MSELDYHQWPTVMISQPMSGISEEMQTDVRQSAKYMLQCHGYEVMDTPWKKPDDISQKADLHYLGQAMETMSHCDAVYFCDGWENSRGCQLEHAAATAYHLMLLTSADF